MTKAHLDQPQGFVHSSAHWEVVDCHLTDFTRTVNNEKTSEANTLRLQQDTIRPEIRLNTKGTKEENVNLTNFAIQIVTLAY